MSKEIKPMNIQRKWFKVLQIFTAYLVAAWTFLQFVDWVVNRYEISTNWVDLWLWVFIGIIPSLLIYIYNQERLNNGLLYLREKIIFPLNVIILAIGLYFGFGTSDLGAATKEITFTNDDGTVLRREITKDEFRIGVPIFNFEQTHTDSTTMWLTYGIRNLLYWDIHQDKNVNPLSLYSESTTEKVQSTRAFYDFYVDGSYIIKDNLFTITPNIRKSKNGKLITSKSFTGPELSKLLDSVSIYIRNQAGVSEKRRERYVDLEIQEFTSDSFKAIEYFVQGEYDSAIAIDSTFALAYLLQAQKNINYSLSNFEEQFTIDKAFDHRLKLPEDRQLQILIYKHIAYEEWEKAEELVKLQLEMEPNNNVYIKLLFLVYSETKQLKAHLDFTRKRFEKKRDDETGIDYYLALLFNGQYQKCIDELDKFLLLVPNDKEVFFYKLPPLILKGDLKEARTILNKASILHPEWEEITKVYDDALTYLEQNPKSKDDLYGSFKGKYRSLNNEQIVNYTIVDGVQVESASNQNTWSLFRSGEAELLTLFLPFQLKKSNKILDDEGQVYALKMEQFDLRGTHEWFAYKLDEAMLEAERLLKKGDLRHAEKAYEKAISNNPDHFYLKQQQAHIDYMKETDSLAIQQQFKEVTGTYGPRRFWVEKGKLFYKRLGKGSLPRIQLLPISKTRYINLTRLLQNSEFEFKDGQVAASYARQYDVENKNWIILDDDKNYFEKN